MLKRPIKYNPAFLSDDELVQAFVVRHTECEMIMQVIRENDTEPNKHVLIIGPRGSGKTMLVRRVAVEVKRDIELNEKWYPLIFAEESYLATTPGEFWLEAIFHLGQQTGDDRWNKIYEELKGELDETRLRERTLAQLLEFADSTGKRILLIVENLHQLFGEQMNDNDAWTIRSTLQHEPRLMLLGSATTRFNEVENFDKAMFELFMQYDLQPLNEEECSNVWSSITGEKPKKNRIRPIQILTGGSPRLLAIISSFATRLSFKDLMTDLVRLVDDHTEYFKSHLDGLPAIERKVYLAMTDMWKPASAREIAAAARLNVNKISSLMGRLIERGVVVQWKINKRRKLYHVAERLYNIYYLMRRRGSPSSRIQAAVNFMLDMYEKKEYSNVMYRIAEEACNLDPELRLFHYLAYKQIIEHPIVKSERDKIIQKTPLRFFETEDAPESIKDLGKQKLTNELQTQIEYLQENWDSIAEEELDEYEKAVKKAIDLIPEHSNMYVLLGRFYHEKSKRFDEAEQAYRKAIKIEKDNDWAWAQLGQLLHENLERFDEAEKAYYRVSELDEVSGWAWGQLGLLYHEKLGEYAKAEKAYRKAIELESDIVGGWTKLGQLLHEKLERYDEAEVAYMKAIEIDKEYAWAWVQLGNLLHEKLERFDEAEAAYRKAIEIDKEYAPAWVLLGLLLQEKPEKYDEAEVAYRKAIEIDKEFAWAWKNLGYLLHTKLGRYDEAEKAYRNAIGIEPNAAKVWHNLGVLLEVHFNNYVDAEKAYNMAVEHNADEFKHWYQLAQLYYFSLEKFDDAEKAIIKAIELNPTNPQLWLMRANIINAGFEDMNEAKALYRKVIELEPSESLAWLNLIQLHKKTDSTQEVLDLAEINIEKYPDDVTLLNNIAWAFYETKLKKYFPEAESWAKEAVSVSPNNSNYQGTLASVLAVQGKGKEALDPAKKYISDPKIIEIFIEDTIDLFTTLAATGFAKDALKLIQDSPSEYLLEPLVVGLRLYIGDSEIDIRAPVEILEVGKDVKKRIEERKVELKQ